MNRTQSRQAVLRLLLASQILFAALVGQIGCADLAKSTDPKDVPSTANDRALVSPAASAPKPETPTRKAPVFGPGCPYSDLDTQAAVKEPTGVWFQEMIKQPRYQYYLNGGLPLQTLLIMDPEVKAVLKEHPDFRRTWLEPLTLQKLADGASGTGEGYTIGEHSMRVIHIFDGQKDKMDLDKLPKIPEVRSWENLVRMTLAFHDIGKSLAVYLGDKSMEEKFSTPLARGLLREAGFNETEVNIGEALIRQHQLIGRYLKGEHTLQQTRENLAHAAGKLGLKPEEFFLLENAVFVADAGSYPGLCERVFTTDVAGRMHIRDAKKLRALFPQPPKKGDCLDAGSPVPAVLENILAIGAPAKSADSNE